MDKTVTEEISDKMGIDRTTVHRQTKKAVAVAKANGVDVDDNATLETMDAETLDAVADAVSKEAAKPKPAKKTKPKSVVEEETVDSVDAKIAEMWEAYHGKTINLGLFRQIVGDAVEIPGRVGVVKDALEKFEG